MFLKSIVILAPILVFLPGIYAQNNNDLVPPGTVALSDFGVKLNSFENVSASVKKAVEYCKGKNNTTLLLPGGRIDLWPEGSSHRELYISNATEDDTLSKVKNIAFLFDGFNNLVVEGNNTLVVLHGKMVSFALINSSNIVFKNVRFDYERPTMSELTIQSVSSQAAEVSVNPSSKYYIDENHHINWYGEGWKSKSFHTILLDTVKNTMTYSSFEPFLKSKAVKTGPLNIRFEGDFSRATFAPGNILSIRDTYRDNTGAFISRSKNIKIENVKMHYMHGLGIVSQFSENISLIKVNAEPPAGSGRVISSFADCFHFSGCKGKILIDSCSTSGSHDDPINVHGTHLKITSVSQDKKLIVRFMHHQTYGFDAFFEGDSIAFVDPNTLLARNYAVIKRARLINKREMEIELKSKLTDAKVGDCIENLTWTPELTIRNCRFERTNTRGILVTTRKKVLIENNIFFRTGMHAILIADDAKSWYESGPVQDVTIRNNRFEECGYNSLPNSYVIAIAPENHELLENRYVHRNIKIENNFFKVFDAPLITARSVDGLQFNNNNIVQSGLLTAAGTKAVIKLTACKNVSGRGNTFNTKWKLTTNIENMPASQVDIQ